MGCHINIMFACEYSVKNVTGIFTVLEDINLLDQWCQAKFLWKVRSKESKNAPKSPKCANKTFKRLSHIRCEWATVRHAASSWVTSYYYSSLK